MTTLITILLLTLCLQASGQAKLKQYRCYEYSIRGKVVRDTVYISIMDNLVFIPVPGHDQVTMHDYVLKVVNKDKAAGETRYSLVFRYSLQPAWLLVSEYYLYFWHDREEYLYFINRKNYK